MKKIEIDSFLCSETQSIIDAMHKINQNARGILFVVDQDRRLVGTVTDGDIRRAIVKTGILKLYVKDVMNRSPRAVGPGEKTKAKEWLQKYQLSAVAVVDGDGKLMDIIFDQNKGIEILKCGRNALKGIPVVIMAGGKGTRLYPFTKILPKPLIPVGDITIIERIIEKFCDYGIDSFYMTVNYKKNMIKSYLTDQFGQISQTGQIKQTKQAGQISPMNQIDQMEQIECRIDYIEEEKPLGTAGSLRMLIDQLSQPFFVVNCDILIRADYYEIYQYHKKAENMITIVSASKNIEVPYGVIKAEADGTVKALEEKPQLSYFINTGMYILNPECISCIPEGEFYHMTDLIGRLLEENQKVGMYPVSEDSFLDMGEWEELQRMERKLKQDSDGGIC